MPWVLTFVILLFSVVVFSVHEDGQNTYSTFKKIGPLGLGTNISTTWSSSKRKYLLNVNKREYGMSSSHINSYDLRNVSKRYPRPPPSIDHDLFEDIQEMAKLNSSQFDLELDQCTVGGSTVDFENCKTIKSCKTQLTRIFGSEAVGATFISQLGRSKVQNVYAIRNGKHGLGPNVQVSLKDSSVKISCRGDKDRTHETPKCSEFPLRSMTIVVDNECGKNCVCFPTVETETVIILPLVGYELRLIFNYLRHLRTFTVTDTQVLFILETLYRGLTGNPNQECDSQCQWIKDFIFRNKKIIHYFQESWQSRYVITDQFIITILFNDPRKEPVNLVLYKQDWRYISLVFTVFPNNTPLIITEKQLQLIIENLTIYVNIILQVAGIQDMSQCKGDCFYIMNLIYRLKLIIPPQQIPTNVNLILIKQYYYIIVRFYGQVPTVPPTPKTPTPTKQTPPTPIWPTYTPTPPILPSNTPQPPIVPTSSPKPPILPSKTPQPPIVPTSSPKPPILPSKTPQPPIVPTSSSKPPILPSKTPRPPIVPTSSPKPTIVPTSPPTPTIVPTTPSKLPIVPTTPSNQLIVPTRPPTVPPPPCILYPENLPQLYIAFFGYQMRYIWAFLPKHPIIENTLTVTVVELRILIKKLEQLLNSLKILNFGVCERKCEEVSLLVTQIQHILQLIDIQSSDQKYLIISDPMEGFGQFIVTVQRQVTTPYGVRYTVYLQMALTYDDKMHIGKYLTFSNGKPNIINLLHFQVIIGNLERKTVGCTSNSCNTIKILLVRLKTYYKEMTIRSSNIFIFEHSKTYVLGVVCCNCQTSASSTTERFTTITTSKSDITVPPIKTTPSTFTLTPLPPPNGTCLCPVKLVFSVSEIEYVLRILPNTQIDLSKDLTTDEIGIIVTELKKYYHSLVISQGSGCTTCANILALIKKLETYILFLRGLLSAQSGKEGILAVEMDINSKTTNQEHTSKKLILKQSDMKYLFEYTNIQGENGIIKLTNPMLTEILEKLEDYKFDHIKRNRESGKRGCQDVTCQEVSDLIFRIQTLLKSESTKTSSAKEFVVRAQSKDSPKYFAITVKPEGDGWNLKSSFDFINSIENLDLKVLPKERIDKLIQKLNEYEASLKKRYVDTGNEDLEKANQLLKRAEKFRHQLNSI